MARRKFAKLKNIMFEKELTQEQAARMLKRSTTYISYRMNGREPFNFAEAAILAEALDIPREAWADYFTDEAEPQTKSARMGPTMRAQGQQKANNLRSVPIVAEKGGLFNGI